jgi:hypothetical protein
MQADCHERFSFGVLSALALLGAALGCGHTAAVQPAPKPADAQTKVAPPSAETPSARAQRVPRQVTEPPRTASVEDVMADHFLIVSWARDSVIAGVLEPMRGPLNALAAYRYEEIHQPGWAQELAELQAAAALTASAKTLDVAAAGVATMGRICGQCHTDKHGGPAAPALPAEVGHYYAKDFVPERMERHMIAAQLLWEGLTGPSDATWKAGADALVKAPDQLDEELPPAFETDLREIRTLGVHAGNASTLAERADVFGVLIATCADCHTRWIEDAALIERDR